MHPARYSWATLCRPSAQVQVRHRLALARSAARWVLGGWVAGGWRHALHLHVEMYCTAVLFECVLELHCAVSVLMDVFV